MTDQPSAGQPYPAPGDPPPQPGGYPPPSSSGDYPPPPPGGYPPPPPAVGGYAPPPPFVAPLLPRESYTPWSRRVLATIIDFIPYVLVLGIGWGIAIASAQTVCVTDTSGYQLGQFCSAEFTALGNAVALLSIIIGLAYLVWNYGYRQGRTGSSIGKSVLKFQVVSERTWAPIGFGLSIVRQLAHLVDSAILYIGYLFPLWDRKRQTIADKIMTTVCVPLA